MLAIARQLFLKHRGVGYRHEHMIILLAVFLPYHADRQPLHSVNVKIDLSILHQAEIGFAVCSLEDVYRVWLTNLINNCQSHWNIQNQRTIEFEYRSKQYASYNCIMALLFSQLCCLWQNSASVPANYAASTSNCKRCKDNEVIIMYIMTRLFLAVGSPSGTGRIVGGWPSL